MYSYDTQESKDELHAFLADQRMLTKGSGHSPKIEERNLLRQDDPKPSSASQIDSIAFNDANNERVALEEDEERSITESMAAMALAAQIAKKRAKARMDAITHVVTETSSSFARASNRWGDRFGGSVAAASAPRSNLPKFNSCSTLFVDATLSNADLTQTLKW
jgi:hypothetical protein